MSWLMVAKMPLLMSSRIMSAGFTPRSSASSLTVIVPGSSMAPRSRGSSVCTPAPLNVPSRRGGLRGPRRPRVPLLLLATRSSFDCVGWRDAPGDDLRQVLRELGVQRPAEGALRDGSIDAGGVTAHIGAATGRPAARVDDDVTGRGPDDANEVALLARRSARHARPVRDAPWGGSGPAPAYDVTSSEGTAAAFFMVRFGLAGASDPLTAAASDVASSSTAPVPLVSAFAAAFFVVRFG